MSTHHLSVNHFEHKSGKVFCSICNEETAPPVKYTRTTGKWGYKLPEPEEVLKYSCKNEGCDWHKQILFVMGEIIYTPSATLVNLMKDETKTILERRTPTLKKNGNNYY